MAKAGRPKIIERDRAKLERNKRIEKAVKLRESGLSYQEVGEEMSVTKSTAWGYVKKALDEVQERYESSAVTVRNLEIRRLDSLLNGVWEKASKGDVGAIDRVLKIMERKSKFLGLDAPDKAIVKSDIDQNINISFGEGSTYNEYKGACEVEKPLEIEDKTKDGE